MGCFASKNIEESKKIDYSLEWTRVTSIDETFIEASGILKQVESLRSGIEDSRDNAIKQSNVYNLREPKFNEALRILFWAVSAGYEGQISKSEVEVSSQTPYLKINCGNLLYETYQLNNCLNIYLKSVIEGPKTIDSLIKRLETLLIILEDLVPNVRTEATNNGLGFGDAAKSGLNASRNLKKIREALPKAQRVKDIIEAAVAEMPFLIEKMQEYVEKADIIGSEAYKSNIVKPKDIFDEYHPGPKLSPEEIAARLKSLINK